MELKISDMTECDVTAIENLEKECFSEPWSRTGIEYELTNCNSLFLTAKVDGFVAGYIGCHIAADEGYIANLAVNSDYRRQGIGKALIKSLIEISAEKGLAFLTLEVRASNESAILLYKSMGFKEVGERKNFYIKPTENAKIFTLYF